MFCNFSLKLNMANRRHFFFLALWAQKLRDTLNKRKTKIAWTCSFQKVIRAFTFKAETHNATNRCDASPRQVASINRLVWHVKVIVPATEFCRCDLSHEFKLVWIHATDHSDKLSASSLVTASVQTRRLVATTCRSDLLHRVSRPLEAGFSLVFSTTGKRPFQTGKAFR